MLFSKKGCWVLAVFIFFMPVVNAQVKVAVAANFYKPMQVLAAAFEKKSAQKIEVSVGSTGKLYAQIKNGAPFDIFFAADQKRPLLLTQEGMALPESQFTYAKGRLVLWSKFDKTLTDGKTFLLDKKLQHIAIANPKAAPYGAAAITVMKNLGVYEQVKDKLVQGQSIGQTFQQLSSGAVQQGFVALSQVYQDGKVQSGTAWIVPGDLYQAIKQDAVLLKRAEHNVVAKQFLEYIKQPEAVTLIQSFGYHVDIL